MKIEFSLLSSLLLVGTTLLARAQAQGIEQALFATAVEYGVSGLRSAIKLLPVSMRLNR
jgi:uncharacterized membrane protein (UPF0136 family)